VMTQPCSAPIPKCQPETYRRSPTTPQRLTVPPANYLLSTLRIHRSTSRDIQPFLSIYEYLPTNKRAYLQRRLSHVHIDARAITPPHPQLVNDGDTLSATNIRKRSYIYRRKHSATSAHNPPQCSSSSPAEHTVRLSLTPLSHASRP